MGSKTNSVTEFCRFCSLLNNAPGLIRHQDSHELQLACKETALSTRMSDQRIRHNLASVSSVSCAILFLRKKSRAKQRWTLWMPLPHPAFCLIRQSRCLSNDWEARFIHVLRTKLRLSYDFKFAYLKVAVWVPFFESTILRHFQSDRARWKSWRFYESKLKNWKWPFPFQQALGFIRRLYLVRTEGLTVQVELFVW